MSTTNKWKSVDKELPTWEDGEVLILVESSILKAKYNELAMWWRVKTKDGVMRLEDEVKYWKPIQT